MDGDRFSTHCSWICARGPSGLQTWKRTSCRGPERGTQAFQHQRLLTTSVQRVRCRRSTMESHGLRWGHVSEHVVGCLQRKKFTCGCHIHRQAGQEREQSPRTSASLSSPRRSPHWTLHRPRAQNARRSRKKSTSGGEAHHWLRTHNPEKMVGTF